MTIATQFDYAQQCDTQDPLAPFQAEFVMGDRDTIYLDGNSLGRLPKATLPQMQTVIEQQWGQRLIRSWNEAWLAAPVRMAGKIARLIGADPDEVLLTDSTSANLFKLAVAALQARPNRKKIVSDELNFPSDLYIFQGISSLLGQQHSLERIPSRDSIHIHPDDIAAAIDANTALVSLTHVAFKSAFQYDMAAVTRLAQQAGALTLWDLSHSVGAVPLAVNRDNVDLAVGCTYKYLNGGPGAPAFLYVRRDLQKTMMQPIWGWFAAKNPFNFELDFSPAENIDRFRAGTHPMLSLLALEPALDIHLRAGMAALRQKSAAQTDYLIELAREWLLPLGFQLGSPVDPAQRGSHISLRHPEAYRINRAMIEADGLKVIPDFRTPDNIRLGIAPIYTSFADIYRAVARMRVIVEEKIYTGYSAERLAVT